MFPVSIILIIAAATFCQCRVAENLDNYLEKYDDYKKSLLKQEEKFLSVSPQVSKDCESTTCSAQTVLLKEALKTFGRSKMPLSTGYQDCMLPCIRKQKPKAFEGKYSSESSSSSSSSESD